MQTPSIGRIVHYNWQGKRVAAIITHVYSDTCVQLHTFAPCGAVVDSVSFALEKTDLESGDLGLNTMNSPEGTWCWPPYIRPATPKTMSAREAAALVEPLRPAPVSNGDTVLLAGSKLAAEPEDVVAQIEKAAEEIK